MRKQVKKWNKTFVFHTVDMAVVNAFNLFQACREDHPEIEALWRSASFSLVDFREELVRELCGFELVDVPPVAARVRPAGEFDLAALVPVY